jgi:quinol monooxygenase YgiN
MAKRDTSAVVELRQYTLHPGRRDELISLFDRHFLETQEAQGMRIIGQFRDANAPDRFVWVRGFRDMDSRKDALQAFYTGPTWRAHRQAANATMIDSDDVLLLRPVTPDSGFMLPDERPPVDATHTPPSKIVATIYLLASMVDASFAQYFDTSVVPTLRAAGAEPIARFQTEYAVNTFPGLPVRDVSAFVWFARPKQPGAWPDEIDATLAKRLIVPVQRLVLQPTARSLLA